jgi:catechol 2,3-dioxygenase-like lactoylglutathione lyase family enzyme
MRKKMTQKQPNRNIEVLAVHSLDHFMMDVPDLEEAKQYFELFGLDVRAAGSTLELYCFGGEQRWAILRKGAPKKLTGLCFACFSDDLARFESHLGKLGVAFERKGESLQFEDPVGLPVEVRVGPQTSNVQVAPFEELGGNTGSRAAALRSECAKTQPSRLAHLAIFTGDLDASIDFYRETLGLRLTDRSLDIVAFCHSPHGSDHHILALLGDTGPGLHHSSWEVPSVNAVGVGGSAMAMGGFGYSWGLGRHVLGSNYFNYIRDPWGSWTEYSAGIDYVPFDVEWDGGDYGPEDSFYLWGPDVPEGFTDNIEQSS